MSEKKMKKDADEKSDETSDERLATASERALFFVACFSKDRRLSRRQTKDV